MKNTIITLSVAGLALASSLNAQTIDNANFTGTPGINGVNALSEWSRIETPDLTDGTTGNLGYSVSPSPDGGTFAVAFGRTNGAGTFYEGMQSTNGITGLSIGETYNLTFHQINIGRSAFNETGDGYWEVQIGGISYNAPTMVFDGVSNQQWRQASIQFTATSNTESLLLIARDSDYQVGNIPQGGYYGIDGLSVSQVPEPSSIALLGLGGIAFLMRRKR